MISRPPRCGLIVVCLLAAWAAGGSPLQAGAENDHDRARAAREAGQVLPLAEILERVRREFPGDVLDVDLEAEHHGHHDHCGQTSGGGECQDGQPLVYEIKLRMSDGRIVKLIYDAHSGALLAQRWR
ncbi:conserved exported hypothetical protein [uncultured Gammaproteobacteria bacterium]